MKVSIVMTFPFPWATCSQLRKVPIFQFFPVLREVMTILGDEDSGHRLGAPVQRLKCLSPESLGHRKSAPLKGPRVPGTRRGAAGELGRQASGFI